LELILLSLCLEVYLDVSGFNRLLILWIIYLDLLLLFLLHLPNSFSFLHRLFGLLLGDFGVKYKHLEPVK